MSFTIELDGLEPELSDKCEQEFQRQAALYDGELFWHFDSVFDVIDLTTPSVKSQVVLAHFANSACPVSDMRFAASLYPFSDSRWPIHSYEAAIYYMLTGLETLQNLKFEPRILTAICLFESSNECKNLLNIAQHIISTNALTRSLCPEIIDYVEQQLGSRYPHWVIH
jgi:hypothetical protein